jgi:NTP pyrophosphatase (non-canonical NTP hydrolase)
MIGLMNEAGEVGGAYKKEIRDDINNRDLIIDEMGDVMWYLTNLCRVYGITLSQLMNKNIQKLISRMTPEQAKEYRESMGVE